MSSQQVRSIAQNRRRHNTVPSYSSQSSVRPRLRTSTNGRSARQAACLRINTPDDPRLEDEIREGHNVDDSSISPEREDVMTMVTDSEAHEASSATDSDTDGSDYDPHFSASSSDEVESGGSPSDSEVQEEEHILVSSASSSPTSRTPTAHRKEPLGVIAADFAMSSPSPEPASSRGSSETSTETNSDALTHVSETPALTYIWEGVEEFVQALDVSLEVEGSLVYEENASPFWFVEPQALLDDALSATTDSEVSLAARYGSWTSQRIESDLELGDSIIEEIEQDSRMSMRRTSEPDDGSISVDLEEVIDTSAALQPPEDSVEAGICDSSSAFHRLPSLEAESSWGLTPSPRSPSPFEMDENERSPVTEIIA